MKNSIIDRIDEYRKHQGLNDSEFQTFAGLANSCLYSARKNNGIGNRNIERILAAYPDLSRTWLMTGEGSMLTDESLLSPLELLRQHRKNLATELARLDTIILKLERYGETKD